MKDVHAEFQKHLPWKLRGCVKQEQACCRPHETRRNGTPGSALLALELRSWFKRDGPGFWYCAARGRFLDPADLICVSYKNFLLLIKNQRQRKSETVIMVLTLKAAGPVMGRLSQTHWLVSKEPDFPYVWELQAQPNMENPWEGCHWLWVQGRTDP